MDHDESEDRPVGAPQGVGRRSFLRAALIWAGATAGGLACRSVAGCGTAPDPLPGDGTGNGNGNGLQPTPACGETLPDIQGPFYRADAPLRWDLIGDRDLPGVLLEVSGRILDTGCEPIEGALIDVWQADDDGRYDNDGQDDPVDGAFILRGRLLSDAGGAYRIRTLVPGHYLNGPTYRPAHLHVKVEATGHRSLTTQLYFPDDPYNATDPFFKPELLMDVEADGAGGLQARFDFVVAPQAS